MGRRRRGKSRFWRNVKRVARNVGKAITPPPPKPSNDLITKNTRMAYLLVELKKKHMRIKKNIVNMNVPNKKPIAKRNIFQNILNNILNKFKFKPILLSSSDLCHRYP